MKLYWTPDRLKLLRILWIETHDWKIVHKSFPEKTISQIANAYKKYFKGQPLGRLIYWTPDRINLLKKVWPNHANKIDIKKYFPEKSFKMIYQQAQKIGLGMRD